MAGLPNQARRVGYALSALPENHRLPWHRVINAKGEVSPRSEPRFEDVQRGLLEREGVVFDRHARISLLRFQWRHV